MCEICGSTNLDEEGRCLEPDCHEPTFRYQFGRHHQPNKKWRSGLALSLAALDGDWS